MSQPKIYKRQIFDEIIKYLDEDNIIVLHGARQVGKTYILYYLENYLKEKNNTVHYVDLEDSRFARILDSGVDEFLKYLTEEGFDIKQKIFVILDEIQNLANPSNFLKLMVDHHKNIKLIVSGSSSFAIKKKFKDSLVGRTVPFEIFGLNFEEFLQFKEYKFIKADSYTQKKKQELISYYQEYCLYGCYPKIVLTGEKEKKEKYIQQIIDTYLRKDIRDLAGVKEIDKFNKLLEVLAEQSGNLLNIEELSNTCNLAKQTVENYLFILENTYIIKLIRPFARNLRSELFKTPKIFFYDSGLQQMLWLKSLPQKIVGSVFETSFFFLLVRKYGTNKINFWRTKDKKEIDFIIKNKDHILPIEVKLNFAQKINLSAIEYFLEKYKVKKYNIVGLLGEPRNSQYIYPWQI